MAQGKALSALTKADETSVSASKELSKDEERELIELVKFQLTDPSGWSSQENPPALHAALRAAYPEGEAAALRAVSAAAWLEIAALVLQAEECPLGPLVSTLEQMPESSSDEYLQDALVKGFLKALDQPKDAHTSWQSVSAALDIWLQHILNKRSGRGILGNLDRSKYFGVLSFQPAQTVDRASRGVIGWENIIDGAPRYVDKNNDHTVEYYSADVPAEALWDEVRLLDPRTADAWRLLTAATLEAWHKGQDEPPSIWVEVSDLAMAMGYRKAKSGGFKPEHLSKVARALIDLERFHITIPLGSKTFPFNPQTGKRRRTKLEASRRHRVIAVFTQDEVRDLFGNKYPMRWQIRVGDWIKDYPPRIYAPLYRALVELPVKSGRSLWAKNIGTELCFQYRQDRNRSARKVLTVEKLLVRACLIEEARHSKDRSRSRDYFEGALDILTDIGVCTAWEYEPASADSLDDSSASQRGWFERWLSARVVIVAPDEIVKSLPSV